MIQQHLTSQKIVYNGSAKKQQHSHYSIVPAPLRIQLNNAKDIYKPLRNNNWDFRLSCDVGQKSSQAARRKRQPSGFDHKRATHWYKEPYIIATTHVPGTCIHIIVEDTRGEVPEKTTHNPLHHLYSASSVRKQIQHELLYAIRKTPPWRTPNLNSGMVKPQYLIGLTPLWLIISTFSLI